MNTNKKNSTRLLQSSKSLLLIPGIIVAVVLAATIGLVVGFALTQNSAFLIALIAIYAVALIAYLILSFLVTNRIQRTYYDQIFGTTFNNIKKLSNNDTNFDSYKDININEINELNDAMNEIKNRFEGSYLIVKDQDYSKLDLQYIDKTLNLVTFESFKKNLSNIIFFSQSFRNVIIEVFYTLPSDQELLPELNRRK